MATQSVEKKTRTKRTTAGNAVAGGNDNVVTQQPPDGVVQDSPEKLGKKTAEWHANRRKGIGGSDVNVIMNGDKEAIYKVWLVKTGQAEPEDLSDVLPVRFGEVTEDLNIEWYERTTGHKTSRRSERVPYAEWPVLTVELDCFDPELLGPVECKCLSAYTNVDDAVAKYMPQIQAAMLVTGAERAALSMFIGTLKHEIRYVDFDPFYCDLMLERLKSFWQHVLDKTPPVEFDAIATPVEAIVSYDMQGDNHWADRAMTWLETRDSAKRHETASKELKGAVPADAKEAFGHGIVITRNKAGSLSIKESK
jgi:YqaJ-like viral recombinase domain